MRGARARVKEFDIRHLCTQADELPAIYSAREGELVPALRLSPVRRPRTERGAVAATPTAGPSVSLLPDPVAFDGSSLREVPHEPGMGPGPRDSLTATLWVYISEPPSSHTHEGHWRTLLRKGAGVHTGASDDFAPCIQVHALSRRVRVLVSTAAAGGSQELEYFESSAVLPLHAWTSLAVVIEGSSVSLFVAGKLDAAEQVSQPVAFNEGPLVLGNDPEFQREEGFVGLLARVRVQAAALSQGTVELLGAMDEQPPPPRLRDEWAVIESAHNAQRDEAEAAKETARRTQRETQRRALAEQMRENEQRRARRRAEERSAPGISFDGGLLGHFDDSLKETEERVAKGRAAARLALGQQAHETARRREAERRLEQEETERCLRASLAAGDSFAQREEEGRLRRLREGQARQEQALLSQQRAQEAERQRRAEVRAVHRDAELRQKALEEEQARTRAQQLRRQAEYRRQLDEQVRDTRERQRVANQLLGHERSLNRDVFREAARRQLQEGSPTSARSSLGRSSSSLW